MTDALDAAVNALRKLGQRSTASVIAEEMACPESEVPVVEMAAMGNVFTCDAPRLETGAIEFTSCQFGLREWDRTRAALIPMECPECGAKLNCEVPRAESGPPDFEVSCPSCHKTVRLPLPGTPTSVWK